MGRRSCYANGCTYREISGSQHLTRPSPRAVPQPEGNVVISDDPDTKGPPIVRRRSVSTERKISSVLGSHLSVQSQGLIPDATAAEAKEEKLPPRRRMSPQRARHYHGTLDLTNKEPVVQKRVCKRHSSPTPRDCIGVNFDIREETSRGRSRSPSYHAGRRTFTPDDKRSTLDRIGEPLDAEPKKRQVPPPMEKKPRRPSKRVIPMPGNRSTCTERIDLLSQGNRSPSPYKPIIYRDPDGGKALSGAAPPKRKMFPPDCRPKEERVYIGSFTPARREPSTTTNNYYAGTRRSATPPRRTFDLITGLPDRHVDGGRPHPSPPRSQSAGVRRLSLQDAAAAKVVAQRFKSPMRNRSTIGILDWPQ